MSLTFERIYQDLHHPIRHYIARLAGSDFAEDLTQEVFISINEHLSSLKDPALIKPWAYRIAYRHTIDCFRQQNRLAPLASDMQDDQDISDIQQGSLDSIDQEWMTQEMLDCIQGYVHQLPEKYRDVIILSQFEGFKNREIAEILGISLDSVKIRLHRAKGSLKQAFQSGCDVYYDASCKFSCEPKTDA